jgi:hypothetical protein
MGDDAGIFAGRDGRADGDARQDRGEDDGSCDV